MIVQDLFKAILEVIGVSSLDEQPEASDMLKVRRHVNLLLGSLSARGLMQPSAVSVTLPLVSGTAAYTVDAISVNGLHIDGRHVELVTRDEYRHWQTVPGTPVEAFYDNGTLYLNPTPDAAATATLDVTRYMTALTGLTDVVTFPDAYHAMLVYNGAIACWRPLGRGGIPPADIRVMAERSMKIIETMNAKQCIARTDLPGSGRQWNILTGEYQ